MEVQIAWFNWKVGSIGAPNFVTNDPCLGGVTLRWNHLYFQENICVGGVARRQTLIQQIRQEHPDNNTVLLDAGDQFQGTLWFQVYKGAEASYFMNKLGYDVMVSACHAGVPFTNRN